MSYITISTFKTLVILSLLTTVWVATLHAQQLPAQKADTALHTFKKNDVTKKTSLKLERAAFNRGFFLPAKSEYIDTLKKSLMPGIKNHLSDQFGKYKNLMKDISGEISRKPESPFVISNGSVSLLGMSSNINNDSLKQNNYNLFDAHISGSVLSIPFNTIYQNHYYTFIDEGNQDRISFKYDKDAYLEAMKKKLKGKFDPQALLQDINDPVQSLKIMAQKKLAGDLGSLKDQYKGLINDKIAQLGNLDDIFLKDVNSISQLLLNNKWTEQLRGYSETITQLQTRINTGQPVDMRQYETVKNELEKYKATQALVKTIQAHNRKWQESGLVKKIKESGFLKKETINKLINDPGVIRKLAKQKLDLNSLQRLFLSVTKLNIGQSTTDLGRMLTGNNIFQGVNTGFLLNKKRSIDVLAGNLKTFNSVLDLPFSNSVFNNNSRMLGLRMQKENTGSISLLAFQTFNNQFPLSAATSLPRRSMVMGISKQVNVNKTNSIQLEVSKSSGQYMNDLSNDRSVGRHNFNDLLDTKNFAKSLAASINYAAEFEDIGLQTETFFRYAGINYDNPATSFIPAGTKEAGTSIRKSFMEKKLQVFARTNWRQYKFSATTSNKYKNSNHFIDLKWKIKKNQYVSLRYQPVRSVSVSNGIKSLTASTERLAASANVFARVWSLHYRNYFTLAYQANRYNYSATSSSMASLQVSSMQSFMVGKHVFYSNTVYNRVNDVSAFIFFNTSFNTDLGITYNIGKNLTASSSVNYNSIQGWYQQAGIKQSLAGELGKKMKMDIYVDIGKNIKVFQPLPYSLFRAEWSLQYMFNR